MEHFIRIAFWIVALGACLPQGNPAPLIATEDWKTSIFDTVTCNNSTFYTPTDVKKECFVKALSCTVAELNGTAKVECPKGERAISWGINTLNHVISVLKIQKNQTMNNSADCECQNWHQHPLGVFVQEVKSLLEKINETF